MGNIKKYFKALFNRNILHNIYGRKFDKSVLILYISHPFMKNCEDTRHQNCEQSRVIARVFDELGYNVDIADYNEKYIFYGKYDIIFDISPKDEIDYLKHLKPGGKVNSIFYWQ